MNPIIIALLIILSPIFILMTIEIIRILILIWAITFYKIASFLPGKLGSWAIKKKKETGELFL